MPMRAAAVVVALLALAACGGSGTRLSRDAYVAKVDAVCRDVNAKQKALTVPTTTGQIPAYVEKALPIFDDALARIRRLRPPSELDAEVRTWLSSLGDSRKLISDLGKAAEHNDAAKVGSLGPKATALGDRGRSLARTIGLTDCSNT